MSVLFNGTSTNVSCSSDASIDNFTTLSVCSWLYFTTDVFAVLASKNTGPASYTGWAFGTSTTKRLYFYYGATVDGEWSTNDNALTSNAWNHVSVTFDKSDLNNDPLFYVNAVLQTTNTEVIPTIGFDDDSSATFKIGNQGDAFITAPLERVQYFNTILTADQITQTMHNPDSFRTNLKGYWKLLSATSNQNDFAPDNNNGTLTNGSTGASMAPIRSGTSLIIPKRPSIFKPGLAR